MARKLLSKKLLFTLHIVLLSLVASLNFQAMAQSVLLPGDIVIVSANADNNTFDFIPLIDIEEGTDLYFSNGLWVDTTRTLTGNELEITFKSDIQAGSNIHVNGSDNQNITVSGNLAFKGGTYHLFTYQKERGVLRFIFGMGWGKGPIWKTQENPVEGSDIPQTLRENEHVLLTLGEASNYQYFIRNGASGTRNLLLKFVGDAANWRGNENEFFSLFGTSFTLMTPPVILFEQSVSTVTERDSVAIINVAIYEHDGARLTVDVVFDSLRSITTSDDFENFKSTVLNFTGLVGNGMYEVEVPIKDDHTYEGRETGIFTLKNLTKGNFGDFLSHSLVVLEDEIPNVIISEVVNTRDNAGFIEIRNMEDKVISLSGWEISSEEKTYLFNENVLLFPGKSLKWVDFSANINEPNSPNNIQYSNLKRTLLSTKGGNLTLKDASGKVVHQVSYSKDRKGEFNTEREELVIKNENSEITPEQAAEKLTGMQISAYESLKPGYMALLERESIETEFPDKKLFIWNEEEHKIDQLKRNSSGGEGREVIFGYFERDEMERLADLASSEKQKQLAAETLSFSVSATDKNENEVIDGLEGLNLVYNDLTEAIPVYRFLELTKKEYPELQLSSTVYGIRQNERGEIRFFKLDEKDEIPSNVPFWVILEKPSSLTKLSLNREALLSERTVMVQESEDEERNGVVEITLASASRTDVLKVHLFKEKVDSPVKDLNSYPDLILPGQSFLNVAFYQGDDYYSELSLSSDIEQQLSLPVHFSSSEDGQLTFSITGWEEIPADWEIKLKDYSTDTEYDLRKDFSATFEYSIPEFGDTETQENRSLEDVRVEDRFVVLITPPKASQEEHEELTDSPEELELHQNFPNPFNPVTTISFYLPESEEVRLSVFNIVGQPVAVIVEGTLSAGRQQFDWDATDKPSGMYIYQLEVGKKVMTRKMTLVK